MPLVAPFRGLQYAAERFGADQTDLVCPPYDVISAAEQQALLARHDRNAVRLELSAEPDPHRAAAEALAAWRSDGTLVEPGQASVYRYAHGGASAPDDEVVRALVVRVLLEPWGDGVRPHEHTMPGPKRDRLALLHATRTQLSPILSLYFDRSPAYEELMSAIEPSLTDARHARDGDGLLHRLARARPEERLLDLLSGQILYVADGHHRYETALAYRTEVRADPRLTEAPAGSLAADWVMMAVVNAEREGLEVQATHRLLVDVDRAAIQSLIDSDPIFSARPIDVADLPGILRERGADAVPLFGLVSAGGVGHLLVGDAVRVAERMGREPGGDALRALDLSVLHVAILGDRLGITAADLAAGERLAYTRSPTDAIERVERGAAAAAFLVRPTRLDQLAAVATAGDVMPQKSTFFYPKLLTGLVFNPVED